MKLFETEERQHSPSILQISEALGGREIIDFCYLSNKFFPTTEILAELARELETCVRNYPSMQGEICRLTGELTDCDPTRIVVGNGASELIHHVVSQFGDRWLLPAPSYMEYENVVRDSGREIHLLPLREEENFAIDVNRLVAAVREQRINAVVLPNPNSPTGGIIRFDDLIRLLESLRELELVLIDESFVEFAAEDRRGIPTLRNELDRFPNFILMRSLGKDYGACGLRLGMMASSNQNFLDAVRRHLPIWNVGPLAEKFIRICLREHEAYEQARIACIRETRCLSEKLTRIPGFKTYPTASNFILVKMDFPGADAAVLQEHLLDRKSVV